MVRPIFAMLSLCIFLTHLVAANVSKANTLCMIGDRCATPTLS
jgi:hypothetical protein